MLKLKLKLIFLFIIGSLILIISCDKTVTPEPDESEPFLNSIVFDSEPKGFTVFINGKVTGAVTPDSLRSIDTGLVTITLSKPLYRDSVFTMRIENNKNYDLFFDIHANPYMLGSIQINSTPPGATIFFNGDSTEFLTPHKFTNLVPGQYEIYLKKEGHWDFNYQLIPIQSNTTAYVNAILEDSTLWVIYNEKKIINKLNHANTIAVDERGYTWVGTAGNGIFMYDGINWTNYTMFNSGLPDNFIWNLTTEGSKVWIATNAGVTLLDNGIFTTYNEHNSPLPSDLVLKIYVHNGKKYFATFSKGFAVFDNINWKVYNTNNSGLHVNNIRCFAVDNFNNLWIGTSDTGIVKYDGNNWSVVDRWRLFYLMSPNITSLAVTSNNTLLIGAVGLISSIGGRPIYSGLGTLINNTLTFYLDANNIGRPDILFERISDIKIDNNESIWISTKNNGILKSKNLNNDITSFNIFNSRLPVNDVREVAFDQQGYKWFATFGGGVVKYKGD